jgi:hypothetical protein
MLVSAYVTMIGFRLISPSKPTADSLKVEDWYRRYGLFMRIVGPVLFVVAVVKLPRAFGAF